MKHMQRTAVAALLGGTVLIAMPGMAVNVIAQQPSAPHDGIWHVATEPETGPCAKRFEFKLSVEDGRIRYAGMWPVNASGSVDPVGLINIAVVRGSEKLSAKGLVRGDFASGEWVSPAKNCTGSWTASKA